MMRSAVIALFLIVVGAVSGMFGVAGIFPIDVDTADTFQFDKATVEEITQGGVSGEFNPLGGLSSIGTMFGIFLNALLNAIWFVPLLVSYGIPEFIAYAIQIPIWFVYVYDIVNWFGNRNPMT